MKCSNLSWIANFIWSIADDVLRDVYVRSKYRDVILPMVVIRRLDAVLEPSKDAVLKHVARRKSGPRKRLSDRDQLQQMDDALRHVTGQSFYNISPFRLRDLTNVSDERQLGRDFEEYLSGFSPNVREILEKLRFTNQIPILVEAAILRSLIQKFLDPAINLGPQALLDDGGKVKLPALDNHAMGTIFEELLHRFGEEHNEETGEHFTPRDVVNLMADLIFLPGAERLKSATYRVYDGACGTGGMLTVAESRLHTLARSRGKKISVALYGQEINPESCAITKADLLLKGAGQEVENFFLGSTLSNDALMGQQFDFMLSNPPYGKSWKTELERMGGKAAMRDPRFVVAHRGEQELRLITRSSDGQLMFLVNMLSKMRNTPEGSRIAVVHNGSALSTGDAGQGESNIRRWILENDWLEAIIALPLNMFYNTSIATYIWVLSNRKPERRRGKVQLIDASSWSTPLRKNLGKKNCELSAEDIQRILMAFISCEETDNSKSLPNSTFGYWKVTLERPLRLRVMLSASGRERMRQLCREQGEELLLGCVERLASQLGPGPHSDFNEFLAALAAEAQQSGVKLTPAREKLVQSALAERHESAAPVIRRIHRAGSAAAAPLYGRYVQEIEGQARIVEYEADTELRETEHVPFSEAEGIASYLQREVFPFLPDAWVDESVTRIGYEISFPRYFHKPRPQRPLAEIRADIETLRTETDRLLHDVLVQVEGR